MNRISMKLALLGGSALLALCASNSAWAQAKTFDVPAEQANKAIPEFARQAGIQIVAPGDQLKGVVTPAVKGALDTRTALSQLLAGTGVKIVSDDGQTIVLAASLKNAQAASNEAAMTESAEAETVVVTGSRIKGAPPTSPVIEITQQAIHESGMTSVGDVVRSLPQNYNGGQNPGISLGSTGNNFNITGASSIDLRGLGPDATLTILNGHRLSYNSSAQGVDLSAIPLAALDRIEIVSDGASAIYGSDAVGGVANIIMKPDYDGVSATARVGGATGGGDFQQQYGLVAGQKWEEGGFIATYDYEIDSAVFITQRDYTQNLFSPTNLLASQMAHSAYLGAHQDINSWITLSLDALYNHRDSWNIYTTSATSATATNVNPRKVDSFEISPKIDFSLPSNWGVTIEGLYSYNNADTASYVGKAPGPYTLTNTQCICNGTKAAEVSTTGSLFSLPAGDVRLAAGAGYNDTTFKDSVRFPATTPSFRGDRSSYYFFGEAYLPLVAADQNIPWVKILSANAAVRYESYDAIGSIATPKFGLKYSPIDDFDVEESWGKSFKAPTLNQQYSLPTATLLKATTLGSSNATPGLTGLEMFGGNPNLQPEKATTWASTFVLHPTVLPGFRGEISYLQISYNNRITLPLTPVTVALSNPDFAPFVVLNPTVAQVLAAVASAPAGLTNVSGVAYDPTKVIAIANDLYTNVVAQKIKAVDIALSYTTPAWDGQLTLTGSGSWLDSHQQTTPSAAPSEISGIAMFPPHIRSREGVSWSNGLFTISAFANYTGGVKNTFVTPNIEGDSMTTVDLSGIFHLSAPGELLDNTDFSLAILNIGDAPPPYLAHVSVPYAPQIDSTNYSDIGRFINFTVTKRF